MNTATQLGAWPAVKLEDEHATLIILPELGGKIVSLRSKATATEFLWQDPTRPYRQPIYGDEFGNYDASGFDECFPTIAAAPYPNEPWAGIPVPDHGELWCTPWRYELMDDRSIYLHAYGVRFPYHFEKWISSAHTSAGGFTLRYRLTNLSPFPFKSLWSAHPLFRAEPGMQVLLPGTPPMRLSHVMGNRIGGVILNKYTWPWLPGPSGSQVDYSIIASPDLDANDKIYANTPAEGWCALWNPRNQEYVGFTLSPAEVPFVGVCINHGGWPPTGAKGFWVAIEPCTGWPDRLDEATKLGAHATLDRWNSIEWSLGLHLGQAIDVAEVGQHFRRYRASELADGAAPPVSQS
ncbi:MAG: DUF5107 domain-containing protein [Herpetosiphonaceae bacterium]|nr:DUF5107 domain-containing protein [Herpetosiphonaceae bacterium]